MNINFNFQCPIDTPEALKKLDQILHALAGLKEQGKQIIMEEQQVKDLLAEIDQATNEIGENVSIIADTDQVISDEIDAFQTALADALQRGQGVTQELIDQAAAVKGRAHASSKALADLVPVLKGIASKGATNVVPVKVPAAPPAA